tara:strand:- start:672 stop:1211 length:540 start_codon:yes stop_codon:yes gene_type:complete
LRWIKSTLIFSFFIISCDQGEVPIKSLDNPLDIDAASEKGVNTPALIFFPDSASVSVGSTVSMEVYAMGVEKLGMAYIKINYDESRLSLSTINPGEFLNSNNNLFLYDNSVAGAIDIYTSFLGSDSTEVSGTGNIAYLVFQAKIPGVSKLTYSSESEFADSKDNLIQIKGFEEGVIHAK